MPELSCKNFEYMDKFDVEWYRTERATFRVSPNGVHVRVADEEARNSRTTLRVRFRIPTRPLLTEINGVTPDMFMLKLQVALEIAMQSIIDGKELWVVEKDRKTTILKREASSLILED